MAQTTIVPGAQVPLALTTPIFGFEGDFGAESVQYPYLGFGQKTSDIVEERPEALGGIIYKGAIIIPKPATISITGGRQYYVQNLPFERGGNPKKFMTKDQVLAAGGNLEKLFGATDPDNYIPEMMAVVIFWVESKDKKSWALAPEVYSHEINGSRAVPALWRLNKTAYREIVPNLRMIERALVEDGRELAHARFKLDVAKQVGNANTFFKPVLTRLADDNPKEVVALLHRTLVS